MHLIFAVFPEENETVLNDLQLHNQGPRQITAVDCSLMEGRWSKVSCIASQWDSKNLGGPGYSNHTIASHSVLCRMMPKLPSITRNITKQWKKRKKRKCAKACSYFEVP
jgi:hypothetical protein